MWKFLWDLFRNNMSLTYVDMSFDAYINTLTPSLTFVQTYQICAWSQHKTSLPEVRVWARSRTKGQTQQQMTGGSKAVGRQTTQSVPDWLGKKHFFCKCCHISKCHGAYYGSTFQQPNEPIRSHTLCHTLSTKSLFCNNCLTTTLNLKHVTVLEASNIFLEWVVQSSTFESNLRMLVITWATSKLRAIPLKRVAPSINLSAPLPTTWSKVWNTIISPQPGGGGREFQRYKSDASVKTISECFN